MYFFLFPGKILELKISQLIFYGFHLSHELQVNETLISFSKYQINSCEGQSLSFHFSLKFSIFKVFSERTPVVWNTGDTGLAYFDQNPQSVTAGTRNEMKPWKKGKKLEQHLVKLATQLHRKIMVMAKRLLNLTMLHISVEFSRYLWMQSLDPALL